DLALLCVFSFLWGRGTLFYVLGIDLLGAGLGICLVMSLLVVIGTVLPLVRDYAGQAGSAAALVTIGGLCLALVGFVFSGESSHKMAAAPVSSPLVTDPERGASAAAAAKVEAPGVGSPPPTERPLLPRPLSKLDSFKRGAGAAAAAMAGGGGDAAAARSPLVGVVVCVAAAIMASMLQFAFVFGKPLVNYAEDEEGVPKILAPLVVWLLAFSLAASWNVVYSAGRLTRNGAWAGFFAVGKRGFAR
ncbi:unnamed protein product, partial [Phaeothamnion confervicola]